MLASLNHPHIAAIYGFDDSGDVHALVLELVEGPTLAERIAEGPIPVEDALPIARQIADALEAAHEQGIVHRDLKPANIKVRPDGTVKVLDFGLAKALEPAAPQSGEAIAAATVTSPALTRMGVVLGTALYMSPEQAKGRPADKRSDVWAFGCVLYEMLTGKRPFEGHEVSDTLASVLKTDPDWNALPPDLPPAVGSLVEGCLRKDRRERVADISTARFLLNQPQTIPASASVSHVSPLRAWHRGMLVLFGAAIGAAAIAAVAKLSPSPPAQVTRFAFALPEGQLITTARRFIAISPDGSHIAYAADGRLYLRSMSDIEPRAIPGTDGAVNPEFAPDSQSLAFWADSAIKRIALAGGVPVTICQTGRAPSGMSWDDKGILFAMLGIGIMRVSENGGRPAVIVAVDGSEGTVDGPQMLPDGRSLLFTIKPATNGDDNRWDNARIVVQSLNSGARKTLIDGGSDGRYVPTGHIVYALRGTLFAVPFSLARLEVTGEPVPVVEGVIRTAASMTGAAHYAISNAGSLVYLPGPVSGVQQNLFFYDRQGRAVALKLPQGSYDYPRVSPDGRQVAYESNDGKETFVTIYELSGRNAPWRLTFGGNNRNPIWSPDGKRIAFQSDRNGDPAVFWQSIDGGVAERLTKPDAGTSHLPESWSPAGDVLLFSVRQRLAISLWTLSLDDRSMKPFDDVRSVGLPTDAAFSPDGRWVAYQTADSNAGEGFTYVQPFPPNGTKHLISRGGRPLWSRDGKELLFIPGPGQFQAVTITTEPSFAFTAPVAVPRRFGTADPASPRPFDITPDGRIIAVGASLNQSGQSSLSQIQVVLNWFEDLKRLVPPK